MSTTFKEAIKATPTESLAGWLAQYEEFVAITKAEIARRKAQADVADPSKTVSALPQAAPKG